MNLSDTDVRQTVDGWVHKGWKMGRMRIASAVGAFLSPVSSEPGRNNSAQREAEAQIMLFFDQLFEAYAGQVGFIVLLQFFTVQIKSC